MLHQRILAAVIGASQLVLAAAFLFVPAPFFALFGFSPAAADQLYLFGQLGARFLAYGIGMLLIARNPAAHRPWWDLMLLIQAVDLAVGVWAVTLAGVPVATAAFPMVNAAVFTALLALWRPRTTEASAACRRSR